MQKKQTSLAPTKKNLEPFIVTDNGELYICHYCEKIFNRKAITKDHKHPKSDGGINDKSNYTASCQKCNLLKADISYDKFMQIVSEFGVDIIRLETPSDSTNHNVVENGLSYNLAGRPKAIENNNIGFGSRILTTVIVKTKLYIFLTKKYHHGKSGT